MVDFTTRLLRRDDLLLLDFQFVNLRLVKPQNREETAYLTPAEAERPSYIVVSFQPQSISEEAFVEVIEPPETEKEKFETLKGEVADPPSAAAPPRPPPVQARIAGRSRLVFSIPRTLTQIPYTMESLLDWTQFELSLAPTALPPQPTAEDLSPRPKIEEPSVLQTAIEFPYRLYISPNRTAGWKHVAKPVTYKGRTELWHTRLGVKKDGKVDEFDASTRTVRAIWSPDYDPAHAPGFSEILEFLTTLTKNNRHQIVRLSSDFNIVTGYENIVFEDTPFIRPPKLKGLLDTPESAKINIGPGLGLDQYGHEVAPSTVTPEINDQILHDLRAGHVSRVSPHVVNAIKDRLVDVDISVLEAVWRIFRYYEPQAIAVKQLMLTSQGAWANLNGKWGTDVLPLKVREPLGLSLVEWEHQATQGRDHYVRTVDLGYVMPFRNLAVKITITERKFETPPGGGNVAAYLRQRSFIVILEPEIHYENGEFQYLGREMPFKGSIRFLTLITPTLDAVVGVPSENIGTPTSGVHWIKVATAPFQFQMKASDAMGNGFPFHTACIFVPLTVFNTETPANAADKATILGALPAAYKTLIHNGLPARTCFVAGLNIAYAPRNGAKEGNTELETDSFLLDLHPINANQGLPFVPFLETAQVHIPAADQVAGGQGAQTIKLYSGYLNSPNGLLDEATNQGQVFAELVAKKAIQFSAEQAGGLSTPNIAMSGISQHLGPVAGTLSNLASGSFVPTDFFPASMNAKLLGGIDLFQIIRAVVGAGFQEQMPQLVAKLEPNSVNPTRIVTTMNWKPQVKSFPPLVVRPNTQFVIDIKLTKQLAALAEPPSAFMQGTLSDFDIEFLGIIKIAFNTLKFTKEANKKLDVHVDIPSDGITFLGPLKFLNELQKYLDPASFADPPVLSVSPTGVSVGYTLTLPPLAIGVFTLKNISLGAILTLPFGGGPLDRMRVRFNLSERHSPFALAVLIFTGGGFFALSLGADGMEVLEIALEFGASFSLDVGVASGGVSAMAGIYFRLEVSPKYKLELTAYLRINGYLSVLGLISISIEFYLELSYKEIGSKNKLIGRATVTVKVEVLMFSTSVSMTVERKFSGSADDPTFSDMLAPGDWAEYGEAFA